MTQQEMIKNCQEAARLIWEVEKTFKEGVDWQRGAAYRIRVAIGNFENQVRSHDFCNETSKPNPN